MPVKKNAQVITAFYGVAVLSDRLTTHAAFRAIGALIVGLAPKIVIEDAERLSFK